MNKLKLERKTIIPAAQISKLIELEKEYKLIKAQIDEYRTELLATMQNNDVVSLKTGTYTLSRSKRITPHVLDVKELKEALDKENIPYKIIATFAPQMNIVFKKLIEDGRMLPGLSGNETEYVSIRIAKEDK